MIITTGMVFNLSDTSVFKNINYLLCNGQAVSRTDYAELFSKIGVNFGAGDGATTFNIPDLNLMFVSGADLTSTVIGKKEPRQIKKHTHLIHLAKGGAHSHATKWNKLMFYEAGKGGRRQNFPNNQFELRETDVGGAHSHIVQLAEPPGGEGGKQYPTSMKMLYGIAV